MCIANTLNYIHKFVTCEFYINWEMVSTNFLNLTVKLMAINSSITAAQALNSCRAYVPGLTEAVAVIDNSRLILTLSSEHMKTLCSLLSDINYIYLF